MGKKVFISYKYGDKDVFSIKEDMIERIEIEKKLLSLMSFNLLQTSLNLLYNRVRFQPPSIPRINFSQMANDLQKFIEYSELLYDDSKDTKEFMHELAELKKFIEPTKVRDYVTELQKLIGEEHVNKGEKDGEDWGDVHNETIRGKLSDKIFDSTVTIVLISPNMKESVLTEENQWIPWEISYSLKNKSREDQSGNDQNSSMNAVLAVVLPDKQGSYEYYIKENICLYCNCRTLKTNTLFKILSDNMFNINRPSFSDCKHHNENTIYIGESSYILSVKWSDFIQNVNRYIDRSLAIKSNYENYNIVKKLSA